MEIQRRILTQARKKYEPYEASRAAQTCNSFNNLDEAVNGLKASGLVHANETSLYYLAKLLGIIERFHNIDFTGTGATMFDDWPEEDVLWMSDVPVHMC